MLQHSLHRDQPFFLNGTDKRDFYPPCGSPTRTHPETLMKKTPAMTGQIVATFIPLPQ